MLIKIAIIVFLIVLLFGCADSGSAIKETYTSSKESVSLSTVPGGLEVYRTRYISAGMTYEAVYIKQDHLKTTALQLQVINLTLDSLRVLQSKTNQP